MPPDSSRGVLLLLTPFDIVVSELLEIFLGLNISHPLRVCENLTLALWCELAG